MAKNETIFIKIFDGSHMVVICRVETRAKINIHVSRGWLNFSVSVPHSFGGKRAQKILVHSDSAEICRVKNRAKMNLYVSMGFVLVRIVI